METVNSLTPNFQKQIIGKEASVVKQMKGDFYIYCFAWKNQNSFIFAKNLRENCLLFLHIFYLKKLVNIKFQKKLSINKIITVTKYSLFKNVQVFCLLQICYGKYPWRIYMKQRTSLDERSRRFSRNQQVARSIPARDLDGIM